MSEEFHFLRPAWLFALPAFWLLVWWHVRLLQRGGAWSRLVDNALRPFVLSGREGRSRRRGWATLIAGTLAVVALAGPTFERLPVPVFRTDSALVVALDLSSSMNAADLKPSRLAMARFKIADLMNLRKSGQTALVVFAAQSFVVTPLTDDTATLLAQLRALETAIMPQQGSEPARAIAQAAELLTQAGVVGGHVLLVTDGANPDALERATEALRARDYSLSVLGVGTPEGAPIPDQNGGFAKHQGSGEIIVSALDTGSLSALAAAGGGLFLEMAPNDDEIKRLESHLAGKRDAESQRFDDLSSSNWREFGPWLLLAVLPFAALGFRRGILFSATLATGLTAGLMLSSPAQADWWRNADQQGAAAFSEGRFGAAAERFEDRQWQGSALYKAGEYDAAIGAFNDDDSASGHYNRGNALARLGRLEEALSAYDKALELDPASADAEYNRKLVEEFLRQQPPPPEQNQQSQDKDDEQSDPQDDGQEKTGDNQDSGGSNDGQADQKLSDGNAAGGSGGEESQADAAAKSGQSPQDNRDEASEQPRESDAEPELSERQLAEAMQSEQAQSESDAERAQATEQWLRRIPDDPAGLLRRKFLYQYKKRHGRESYPGDAW